MHPFPARPALVALAAAMMAGSAYANPPAEAERPGRYVMQPVDGGVLRMDTDSGAMSLCTRRGQALSCEPVQDERSGQAERERLASENRELRADIKRLEDQMGLGDKPPAAGSPNAGPPGTGRPDGERPASRSSKFNLPTEQDLDQALSYVERMVKKLREKWKDIESSASRRGTQL